tara:strand:- start:1775 stop:2278 length:504 start_codon:yes stop_codon:yes gene_type:complete
MIKGKNTCVLQLGSNMDGRRKMLAIARDMLGEIVGSLKMESSLYESEPWGNSSLNWFLNQIVVIDTSITSRQLLEKCQYIESEMGRSEKTKSVYENRIIDIDIIFYNNEVVDEVDLQIPHEKIPQRRFVLEPLVELIPQHIHPTLNQTVSYLLENTKDGLVVNRLDS